MLQAQSYCPGVFHCLLAEVIGRTVAVQQRSYRRGAQNKSWTFVNQKIFDKNGLLTDSVIVEKETEIGKISRAVMGHESGKLNTGFGERRN